MDKDHSCVSLFDCAGPFAPWISVQCTIVFVLYTIITFYIFLPAAHTASTQKARLVWFSLSLIFPFCGFCGYGTTVLAIWYPDTAYLIKTFSLAGLIVSCLFFIYATKQLRLTTRSKLEASGMHPVVGDESIPTSELLSLLKDRID